MSECLNITCRNFDPHNHGEDCDDFCQTCNTPIAQRPALGDEFMADSGITPLKRESKHE